MDRYFGKYRGVVSENNDPKKLGRIRAVVPSVLGPEISDWAVPCLPFAGPGFGLYFVPPVDAGIWIEFEGGDPQLPIWSGCYWREGELVGFELRPGVIAIKNGFTSVVLDDSGDGSILIEHDSGARIVVGASGVVIDDAFAG